MKKIRLLIKNMINDFLIKEERLIPTKISQDEMIRLGATGSLSSAYERYIPIDKIEGLDPSPADWTDEEGNVKPFKKGQKINSSIEVIYDSFDDVYYLQNGNHRIKQAKINGDKYIRAFIQPDRGSIGDDAKLYL